MSQRSLNSSPKQATRDQALDGALETFKTPKNGMTGDGMKPLGQQLDA